MIPNTPEESKANLRAAALEYAAKGVPVFPCLPYGKKPATPNGFKDRTTDLKKIEAWWTAEPQANIGIVPDDQGLAVIDLDGEEGLASWQAEYDHLCPLTRTHRTPSGGLHLFYTGTVRPTAGKLGPGIDTRGQDSYVLVPPSVVRYPDGTEGQYTIEDDREHAGLSECIDQALASIKQERKEAPPGIEDDTPYNVSQAIEYLAQRAPLAVEGQGGDQTTFTVAAAVREYGISPVTCFELMLDHWNDRCSPPWDHDELWSKIEHAYEYAQNEAGCRAVPKDVQDAWIAEAARLRQEGKAGLGDLANSKADQSGGDKDDFEDRWIDEFEDMPELDYWDTGKMLPRFPGGAIAILYGDFGSHKTNTTLALMLDAVLDKGARVAFAAGEGAYGVGKSRVPAHCRARGVKTRELRNRFALVPRVPLFANDDQVGRFIEKRKKLKPNIIVLDTFATAIAGVDENSSQAAHFLTGNGAAARIRREFDALVILPAHEGKTAGRGIRGNSGFGGNADVVIHCEADAGVVKLTVEKMRDGPTGHSVYFAVNREGVPVPERISKEEYEARKGKSVKANGDAGNELTIRLALTDAKAGHEFMAGLNEKMFAEFRAGPEPTKDDDEAHRVWRRDVKRYRKEFRNTRRAKWAHAYCTQDMPSGGTELEWRWHLPLEH